MAVNTEYEKAGIKTSEDTKSDACEVELSEDMLIELMCEKTVSSKLAARVKNVSNYRNISWG